MKTQWAKDLRAGARVDSNFMVMEKELRPFKTKPGNYLQLKLGDRTGTLRAKCWDDVGEVGARFSPGDVVRVRGTIEEFQDNLEVKITRDTIRKADERDIDIGDYVPRTEKDIEKMWSELRAEASVLCEPNLRRLLNAFFDDEDFAHAFKSAPAAKIHHHNYIGGLLEHTLSVVEVCKRISELYPELDRDLLVAGAMLHDIGKTREFTSGWRIDVTPEGGLAGHLVLGAHMLDNKMRELGEFPHELKLKLYHLMLSHHGKGEWDSPVRPRFGEALALHYADLLDSHVKEFLQIEKSEEGKERDGPWSAFSRELERYLYLGDKTTKEKK